MSREAAAVVGVSCWHGNGTLLDQGIRKIPLRAEVPLPGDCVISVVVRTIRSTAGVFAVGHLGELTQYLPFELADAVLEEIRKVQRRLRDLPSRFGVYFVLALCLFPRRATWAYGASWSPGWTARARPRRWRKRCATCADGSARHRCGRCSIS